MKHKTRPSMDMIVTTIAWRRCLGSDDGARVLEHINMHNKIYTQIVTFANLTFATAKFCTPY